MGGADIADAGEIGDGQRKEIYTYEAPWTVFAMAWSHRTDPGAQFRLAIGSCVEKYSNAVQIVKKRPIESSTQHDNNQNNHQNNNNEQYDSQLYKACELEHPYPCTKILWSPETSKGSRDLLATTGDYLRIWNVTDEESSDGTGGGTVTAKKEIMFN